MTWQHAAFWFLIGVNAGIFSIAVAVAVAWSPLHAYVLFKELMRRIERL